jgi:hypothetical protein
LTRNILDRVVFYLYNQLDLNIIKSALLPERRCLPLDKIILPMIYARTRGKEIYRF